MLPSAAFTSRARSALTFVLFMLACMFFLSAGVSGKNAPTPDNGNAGPSPREMLSSWTPKPPKMPSPNAAQCMGTGDPECPFGGKNMPGKKTGDGIRFPPRRIYRTDGPRDV